MDKRTDNIDIILRQALSPNQEPNEKLNKKIILRVKEKDNMKYNKKRVGIIAAAAIIACTATAFAALKYLKPYDVANAVEDKALSKAFQSDNAVEVNETQIYGDYSVTFLGIVSGNSLSDFVGESNGKELTDRTYAVVAIAKSDGTPMPSTADDDYGETPFLVTPLIKGTNPKIFNAVTMNGCYSEIVRDGIMYRIAECDNVEMFAYKGAYMAVSSSSFYDDNAYVYNEETGEISRNENYVGVNALFELPLDKTKSDETAGEKYINEMNNKWKK